MTGQDGDAGLSRHGRPPYDPHADGGAHDAGAPQPYAEGGPYDYDAGQPYPPQPTYDAGRPYDPQQPYGPGPAQESVQPFDPQYGQHARPAGEAPEGAGHPQGWTYVPEPLSGQLPPEAESGAAFGVPSSGDSWDGGTAAPGAAGGWGGAPVAGPEAGGHGQGGFGHGGSGAAYADGGNAGPGAAGGWGGAPVAGQPGQDWPGGPGADPATGGYDGRGGRSGPGRYEAQSTYGHAGPGAGFADGGTASPGGGAAPADGNGWGHSAGGTGGGRWAGADAAAPGQPGRTWQGGPGAGPAAGDYGHGGYGTGFAGGGTAGSGAGGFGGQDGAQPQPHGYADPQTHPYGPQATGIEHTAVLPVFSGQEAGPSATARGGQGGQPGVTLPRQHGPHAPQGAAAPVRTGSPIIPPGIQPAVITVALALLAAGGAALGKPALAVALLALEGLTAAGWFRLNGMWPARQGIMLAFLGGVTADIGLLAADGGHATEVLLGTMGVWLLLVLVLQLRHHGSADERLSSLTATSVSTLLTVVAASYLATAASGSGSDPVVVGAVAVGAATLVRAVRLPGGEPVSVVLALVAAAATAAATGPMTGFGTGHGLLLAPACGAAALIGLRVASYDFPSRFVHFTAGVALPLTAAAPVVYALGAALT